MHDGCNGVWKTLFDGKLTASRRQVEGKLTATGRKFHVQRSEEHEKFLIRLRLFVRANPHQPLPMTKEEHERARATMKAQAYPRNSHLYRWLREHHRMVGEAFKATGAGWGGLLAVVLDAGVVGRQGAPPNKWSVRKVWLRVCADITAEVADQGATKSAKPPSDRSRQKGDWQPPITRRDTSVGRRVSPPTAAPVPAQQGDEHLSERVRAQLAAVDEQFAYLDRHIIRPKQRT
jgi:hypothetical protein